MTAKQKASTAAPASAPVVAPAPAPALTFEKVAVPTVTRQTKANPYADAVSGLAETVDGDGRSTEALSVVVPADKADANARLLREAGSKVKPAVTVRHTREDAGTGNVRLTFWTVKKITRKKGDKPAESASA